MASFLLLLATLVGGAVACPNMCSGHGECGRTRYGSDDVCTCFAGYFGGDCSQRICPKGPAWTDIAYNTDEAHGMAECSSRGACDRTTGQCMCYPGFEGIACTRMECPNECNGHGQCRTMRKHAGRPCLGLRPDDCPGGDTFAEVDHSGGDLPVAYDQWDADMIWGCHCDSGYSGYDCSLRDCPRGDDPLTTDDPATLTDESQLNEVQIIECAQTQGFFTVTYKGQTTSQIAVSTSAIGMTALLNELSTIDNSISGVSVSFSHAAGTACVGAAAGGPNYIRVEFLQDFGNLPPLSVERYAHKTTAPKDPELKVYTDGLADPGSDSARRSVAGTKENRFCSGRGACDQSTGVCTCFLNYVTSDGQGQEGTRGDCGATSSAITSCPGEIACSGHGVCSNAPAYKCACALGWTGGDCSERKCPEHRAWFDFPSAVSTAHANRECSNRGICDRTKGECTCHVGFAGAACERTDCPNLCSGHGQCLSMQDLALRSEINGVVNDVSYGNTPNKPSTWDFNKMHGCLCDPGYEGADCALVSCPTGDDPHTYFESNGNAEVQVVRCTADGGTFRLQFREQITEEIPYDANALTVEEALEALPSIGKVSVAIQRRQFPGIDEWENVGSRNEPACSVERGMYGPKIMVMFLTEMNKLPPLQMDASKLECDSDGSSMGHPVDGLSILASCQEPGEDCTTASALASLSSTASLMQVVEHLEPHAFAIFSVVSGALTFDFDSNTADAQAFEAVLSAAGAFMSSTDGDDGAPAAGTFKLIGTDSSDGKYVYKQSDANPGKIDYSRADAVVTINLDTTRGTSASDVSAGASRTFIRLKRVPDNDKALRHITEGQVVTIVDREIVLSSLDSTDKISWTSANTDSELVATFEGALTPAAVFASVSGGRSEHAESAALFGVAGRPTVDSFDDFFPTDALVYFPGYYNVPLKVKAADTTTVTFHMPARAFMASRATGNDAAAGRLTTAGPGSFYTNSDADVGTLKMQIGYEEVQILQVAASKQWLPNGYSSAVLDALTPYNPVYILRRGYGETTAQAHGGAAYRNSPHVIVPPACQPFHVVGADATQPDGDDRQYSTTYEARSEAFNNELPGHRHFEPCDSDGQCQVQWTPTQEDVVRRAPEEANGDGYSATQGRELASHGATSSIWYQRDFCHPENKPSLANDYTFADAVETSEPSSCARGAASNGVARYADGTGLSRAEDYATCNNRGGLFEDMTSKTTDADSDGVNDYYQVDHRRYAFEDAGGNGAAADGLTTKSAMSGGSMHVMSRVRVHDNEAYQCTNFDGTDCVPPSYDGAGSSSTDWPNSANGGQNYEDELDACERETTATGENDMPTGGYFTECSKYKHDSSKTPKQAVSFCHKCEPTSDCSMVRASCGDGVCEEERGENVYTCPSAVGGGDCDVVPGDATKQDFRPCCTDKGCTTFEANCALGCDHDGVCEPNGICDGSTDVMSGATRVGGTIKQRNMNKAECTTFNSKPGQSCFVDECTVRKGSQIIIKEDFYSCPSDCPMLRPSCGDGTCESSRGENSATCASDCAENLGLDREETPPPPAFLPLVEVATADCTHDSDHSTVDEDQNVFTWKTERKCDDPIDAYTKQGQNNRDYGCTECTWDTWDPATGGGSNNLLGFDRSDGIDSHGGPADKRGNFIPCQDNCRTEFDSVMSVVKGSRENVECAGRGICDHATGQCNCFQGYGSSNGLPTWGNGKVRFDDQGTHVTTGGEGSRRDCGFVQPVQVV